MQPVMYASRFVHHKHCLSAEVSRYLSHSINIPSHAQDQQHPDWTCAARLPGIHDVNLVAHTMSNGTASIAWSCGMYKPEKPTQGASARAGCPRLGEIRSQRQAQCAKRTGFSMADASHRMTKPAPQSAAQYLPLFAHTGHPRPHGDHGLSTSFVRPFEGHFPSNKPPIRPVYGL